MSIAKQLNYYLERRRMTGYRLAKITGIGHDSMSHYRNGKVMPKTPNLIKIAKALNITVDELLKDV